VFEEKKIYIYIYIYTIKETKRDIFDVYINGYPYIYLEIEMKTDEFCVKMQNEKIVSCLI
jgi:hypothetical protein